MPTNADPLIDLRGARAIGADAWLETSLDHPEDVAVTREGLLYAGGEDGQLYRIDPASNAVEVIAQTPGAVLGVELGPDGDLYACDFQEHAVYRLRMRDDRPAGAIEKVVAGGPDEPPLHPNYLAFDFDGRMYLSDSGRRDQLPGPFEDSGGCLYVVDPDGTERVLTDDLSAFPNGIALSADAGTLYVCESGTHTVSAVPLDDGAVPPDAEIPTVTDDCGMVDGVALDAEDRLYVASIGDNAVYRITPGSDTDSADEGAPGGSAQSSGDPAVELLVHDPTGLTINNPTNVAFGGPDMRTLYVANLALWHVTAIEIDATGRHPTGRHEP